MNERSETWQGGFEILIICKISEVEMCQSILVGREKKEKTHQILFLQCPGISNDHSLPQNICF